MVDKLQKRQCNGCKMCADICPTEAITFFTDARGFWYPRVDEKKCIKCGKCVSACPHQSECKIKNKVRKVYAAWTRNDALRLKSTSGGIFVELAKYVLKQHGFVVGCVYTNRFHAAKQIMIDKEEDLEPLMQSKYLQSDTAGIYKKVKAKLDDGRYVLFAGTPCQNAALCHYLGRKYETLIQVEFICRGITSPLAHEKYIDYLEESFQSEVTYFRSKDKRETWNAFGSAATFKNGKEYFKNRGFDPKVVSYHKDLTVRSSCETCVCKGDERVADITLGDFWGIEQDERNPKLEYGTSALIVNTEEGENLLEQISEIEKYEKKLQDVTRYNPAFYNNLKVSKYADAFWSNFDKMPFDKLVLRYANKGRNRYLLKRGIRKLIMLFRRRN